MIRGPTGRQIRWLHSDRLGSIETVTDETGQAVAVESFDAFGAPRDTTWQDNGRLLGSPVTTRGFTKHEHLDQHGLIHMNGRAYDPGLGRFLSVDPFVKDIANSQDLNAYSYVINNPLSATDPSGYERGEFVYGMTAAFFWPAEDAAIIRAVEGGCGLCGEAVGGMEFASAIKEGAAEVSGELNKGESMNMAAMTAIGGRVALKILQKVLERKAQRTKHKSMVRTKKKDSGPKKSRTAKNNGSLKAPAKKDVAPSDVGSPASEAKDSWKGPTDYSHIADPKNVDASTRPTARQVQEMKEANREHNDGVLRSDQSGAPLVDSAKSQRGVTPPSNEAHIDHKVPVDKGGTRETSNLQLLMREENRAKWNK